MKKIWGNVLFRIGKITEAIFNGLIYLMEAILKLGIAARMFVLPIVVLVGLAIFAMPLILVFILTPGGITLALTIAFILLLPFLGRKGSSWLKYAKYVVTEYLYAKSDYYRFGRGSGKGSFSDYSNAYKRKQEEEFEKERQRQREEQNAYWNQVFEEFFRQNGSYNGQGGYTGGYGGYQSSYNPMGDFKSKYEKSCDILGVSYSTDIYEVKLNYRKLAKKYHPDLNKEPGADEKFKEITEAYDFLSEDNIKRYKNLV